MAGPPRPGCEARRRRGSVAGRRGGAEAVQEPEERPSPPASRRRPRFAQAWRRRLCRASASAPGRWPARRRSPAPFPSAAGLALAEPDPAAAPEEHLLTIASAARAPNTSPSRSELLARRFAPWTPLQATSPAT